MKYLPRISPPPRSAIASPALATGKMTARPARRRAGRARTRCKASLVKQGWQVRKSKVDGGCYEVYGTDPQGNRVEAYFHPVTFEKLLVSRRGEVLVHARSDAG